MGKGNEILINNSYSQDEKLCHGCKMTVRWLWDACKITEKRMWDDYEMVVKWIQEYFKVWTVCEIIIDEFMNIGCLENYNCDIAER